MKEGVDSYYNAITRILCVNVKKDLHIFLLSHCMRLAETDELLFHHVVKRAVKVRFVRCPKCQLVLPELADIPVYKCGGCGTVLQAKNRKRAPIKNSVPDQNEISCASEEACPPPKGDSSLNEWKKSDQGGAGDCNKELHRQLNSPDEPSSTSGLSCLENEDPLSKSAVHKGDEHSCALDEKTERYENESRDHHQFTGGENFPNRLASSDELTCPELGSPIVEAKEDSKGSAIEEREKLELDKDTGCPTLEAEQDMEGLALEATEQLELDEDNFLVDDFSVNDQNESGISKKRLNSLNNNSTYSECVIHRDEVSIGSGAHEDGVESKSLVEQFIGRGQNDFQGHSEEASENVRYTKDIELARDFEKQSSVCSEMYQSILNESIISDTLMSTDHEQFEQFQKEIPSGFDRISSMDMLENLPIYICRSDPPVNLRNKIRSPTHRSYYAYDGSASSCDGDDHTPNQYHHQPGRKFKEAYPVSPSEFLLDGRCRVNHTMSGESKIMQQAMNFSTAFPPRSHEEFPQSRKHGRASGGRMTSGNDEHATSLPFISTGSHAGHKHGNRSNYRKNMGHHSSLHPPRMPSDSEPDKIELLRMVYELEDQLRQTRINKRMANGQFSAEVMRDEEYNPSYYDQFLEDGEVSGDLNYSRYPVRCSHGKGWPQQRKSSRIPFSSEASHHRHQADCRCLHCSPQVRHFSPQLHPSVCYNKGLHRVAYSSCNCCNHLQSGSSSPQNYSSSEYSRWDRETKSDDRRHKDHEMKKLYLREKYSKMRHLRPVAGGAPIISCYHCSELLQLPADFLLFKRRYHQLRCNACRKVLKFSLQNQMHVVPFHAEALAPPPNEVDDNTDQQNPTYEYHLNSCPRTETISCSDDLGPSFCRSVSTEGEFPIQPLGRTSFNRDISSSSSAAPTKERKMKSVMRERYTGSPGPSAKMSKWGKAASSEIEKVPPNGGSPLHRLMGYSSPSEVIHW
ncbi:hypothetical protein RND71_018779 [Anisodus tanguticus]|uniref:Zinc-ribbon domain-containing protein n=1 Tax=Anisodus tanguticus TaxID=243964 RepID=A0AAE1S4R8_9SOLA|nr:hypothetical protein RND71_018779 [Anisodus tanguticus]